MLRSSLHSNKLSYDDLLLSKPLPPLIGAFDLLLVCIGRESHSLHSNGDDDTVQRAALT